MEKKIKSFFDEFSSFMERDSKGVEVNIIILFLKLLSRLNIKKICEYNNVFIILF